MRLACLVLFTLICAVRGQSARFHVIRQWKYVNFTWPSEDSLRTAITKGLYIPENNIIGGVKYFQDFYYLTLPRMRPGVPATVVRIPGGVTKDTSPKLEPFPSWEMNNIDDCNNLQNVQNIEIDAKGQMWIIDSGRIDTLTTPVVRCSPKLLIFDIVHNRTTTVYTIPEEISAKENSFLYDLVVDDTDGGYAYITEQSSSDPGIIVYSVKENRAWKIRNARSMHADPSAAQFFVNGISVSAAINIAGIALGPRIRTSNNKVVVNEDREVYFSPLSSLHLFSINTTVLRNETRATRDANYDRDIKDVGLKSSQSAGMIMDNQGILYFGLLADSAIGRWDTHTPFASNQRVIGRDEKYIEWPNSFTFDQTGNLTAVMNRLNIFITDKLDMNGANFRLISAQVGGKSYVYDDKFNYDSDGGLVPSPEPTPTAEPVPKAEPTPKAEPNPQPKPLPDHNSHTFMNSTRSSGVSIAVSVLCISLSSVLLFA